MPSIHFVLLLISAILAGIAAVYVPAAPPRFSLLSAAVCFLALAFLFSP
jgi:membrane protein YdbS with pleckstrin-like domain